MPILFPDDWDEEKKKWKTEKTPTLQDGWDATQEMLVISGDNENGIIRVAFDHRDPEIAKQIVEHYLAELSGILRQEVLRDAAENMRFFRAQLERTSDPLLKEKIYDMLAKEIEKDTFARAQKYYGFLVLDAPIAPDPDKKVSPKRSLICILSVLLAFLFAAFLAFLKEYIHRLKREDEKGYQELVQGLKIRKTSRKKGP